MLAILAHLIITIISNFIGITIIIHACSIISLLLLQITIINEVII
jgi:hypothetical protein